MARDITTDLKNAAESTTVRPVCFIELEFDEGTLNLWDGVGDVSWDGKTWTGAGKMLSAEMAQETQDLDAQKATFRLSGVPDSIVATALASEYQGRPVRAWLGLYDSAGSLISDPVRIFSGKMDTMPIHDDPNNPIIELTAESDLVRLTRSNERRYTHEDQQIDYPGDMFFEFVTQMQDKEIVWG